MLEYASPTPSVDVRHASLISLGCTHVKLLQTWMTCGWLEQVSEALYKKIEGIREKSPTWVALLHGAVVPRFNPVDPGKMNLF